MINIICYDLNGEPLRRFYQYDVGQKMVLKDLALSPTPVVTLQSDTCVQPEVATVAVSGNDLLVTISDSLLEDGLPLRGVVYRTLTPDENVIGMIYIPVVQRVPPMVDPVEEAREYAEQAASSASDAAGSASAAANSATAAAGSAGDADDSADEAELWATGELDGTPASSSDPQYQNNAKYYAQQAASSASDAETAKNFLANVSASATTLSPGASATAAYSNGQFSFGIPGANSITSVAKTGTSGSVDTYTITFTNGATTTFTVTNGEITESRLEEILDEYARTDGYYETLTSGDALQLVSTVGVEDRVPYSYRSTAGSADVGDRLEEKIVGGSIVWNQIQASTASREHNGITYTYSGGKVTAAGTATANSLWIGVSQASPWDWYANHVYLVDVGNASYAGTGNKRWQIPKIRGGSDTLQIESHIQLLKPSADFNGYLTLWIKSGETVASDEEYWPQVFDLTQMFGSTVADHIYSLETATAGAGATWFKSLFRRRYYSYNAGEIMSVKAASHETVGFNQWDEEWESGSIASRTGANSTDTTRVRAKNNIPVLPNTTYYFKAPVGSLTLFYYDSGGEYIDFRSAQRNSAFTTIENAAYIRFTLGGSVNPVTNIDRGTVCVNLSWSGYRDGEYEAYKKRTYPLDTSLELRGIPKLDSSNRLCYDGDNYESDGTVTRKYGIVDLGTLTWSLDSRYTNTQFYSALSDAKSSPDGNMICAKYSDVARGVWGDNVDKTICVTRGTPHVLIVDSSYSDSATFKAAMSGVYLVYELATPTTETAEPFQSPQIVDDFGTEEYTDYGVQQGEREAVVPVGHESVYRNNLRDKLQRSPEMPGAPGDYIMRYAGRQCTYVPYQDELPSAPSENGTYRLIATVAGGMVTYSWEVES